MENIVPNFPQIDVQKIHAIYVLSHELRCRRCAPTYIQYITINPLGQWLWLSWQSGRFRYQRSAVRIQTSAHFYRTFIYCQLYCFEKTKIKEKEAGNGHF